MYREQILDLYAHPLNFGHLEQYDITYEEDNPLCGDVIRIEVRLGEDGHVAEAAWSGNGCAISQAAASLLTEHIKGMTLPEIKSLDRDDILELLGIELSMARIKCATLSLKVLKSGVYGLPDPEELRKHL